MNARTELYRNRLQAGLLALLTAIWFTSAPHAQASDDNKDAMATMEVLASASVLQDQVRVVFSTQASASTPAQVNRKLSENLSQAREGLTLPQTVELSSGGFNVYLDYGKDNKPRGWTGRASLVVQSKELESVSAVIEHLGKSLAVSSVQFSLSREARRAQEQALMKDLAKELRERAALATEAFGFKGFEIVALDFTGGANFSARPAMQRIAAAPMLGEAGPSLTLEPSLTTVEISVTGQIRLRH
ncbi:SIMPL domain-containing protein [Orrella daihaiensis]|uniref:SIMPL domain-containing protein n=1 Tax=Orrella daihaiensis TaxID=2782176 RepID=A0ABY4ARR4_9BURK|nr:SIMPL domain-containing protein [Orrella daihaiensis]UOD50719.1 SIMPL domain-containing protein [Orrella daihaiensis]